MARITMFSLVIGRWLSTALISFLIMLNTGCIAVQSFPMAARAGDTVQIAVGSPEGMTVSNTSATFTPGGTSSGNPPVPLAIRSIFKLYPDKSSAAWLDSPASSVEIGTGHGPWTTIIAADIPTELSPGVPLPTGPGVVQVSTSAVYPPPPARDINTAEISLEILPNTGSPDPFRYELAAGAPLTGDLSQLEPERRIVVKPIFSGTGGTTYGAIEVRLNIPFLDAISSADFRIIADEKIGFYSDGRQVSYLWSVQGSDLVVSFMSPSGGLEYYYAHFSIISPTIMSMVDSGFINVDTLIPTVIYYDINGSVVTGGDTFEVLDQT